MVGTDWNLKKKVCQNKFFRLNSFNMKDIGQVGFFINGSKELIVTSCRDSGI